MVRLFSGFNQWCQMARLVICSASIEVDQNLEVKNKVEPLTN